MERETEPAELNAAGMLATVRAIRWSVRTRYLRALFGGAWFLSLVLALAAGGSIVIVSVFGTRTTDGGQAAFGALGAGLGLGGLSPVVADGRLWPIAAYAAAFLVAGVLSWLVERRTV